MIFNRVWPKLALCVIASTLYAENVMSLESYSRFKPAIISESAIVIDADTGAVLFDKNSQKKMPPASLTKMMTMYIASEAYTSNVFNFDTDIAVSPYAANMDGSKMFISNNQTIKGHDAVQGIIVSSGNDVAVAMAEFISGTSDNFTKLMNSKSEQLGMFDTHFSNPTGLHTDDMLSTAYDLALLSRSLIQDFPDLYDWYKQKSFTYNDIKQSNRNRLLYMTPDADGIKTGFTSQAGYCLASSTLRDGRRLIIVTLNAPNEKARYDDHLKLINYAYREFDNIELFGEDEVLEQTRVWFGQETMLAVSPKQPIVATIPKSATQQVRVDLVVNPKLTAPIEKNQPVGTMTVSLDQIPLTSSQIVAKDNVELGGWLTRQKEQAKYWAHQLTQYYLK